MTIKKILSNIAITIGIASAILIMSVGIGASFALASTTWTCNSAVLEGDITANPVGLPTSVWFNWGTTNSFGNTTAQQSITSTGQMQVFSQSITGLSQNTTYYYRAVGQNSQGVFYGQTHSFTTSSCGTGTTNPPPTCSTQSVTNPGASSVILNGYVDPAGVSNTTAWFEWGTNPSAPLGNITPSQTYGASPMSFSYTLTNLSNNTTYYYRAVAQNQNGTCNGQIYSLFPLNYSGGGGGTIPIFNTSTGGLNSGWGGMVYGSGTSNYAYYNNYPSGCTSNCGVSYYSSATYGNQPVVNTYSPTVSGNFAVLNGYVDPIGNSNVIRWFEWGTNQYSLANTTNKSSQSYAGTWSDNIINLVANTTYYYRAAAQSNSGTTYGQVISFTTGPPGSPGSVGYNYVTGTQSYSGGARTLAVTNLPSSVTQTSARMNGQMVLQNTGTPTNGWFEWGASGSLGNTTQTKNVGGNTTNIFNEYLSNLSPNTTYYYRAVGQNQYGIFKGDIVSFVTGNPVVVETPTTVTRAVATTAVARTSVSTQSLISISISNDNEGVCRDDRVTFTVNYENASKETLKDVVLRVVLPKELAYQDASKGVFSDKDNMVTVAIGILNPGESGIVVVKAVVAQVPAQDKTLVTTANVVYTRTSGAQEEVVAYTLEKPGCVVSTSSALALFGAGGFFPDTLLGWLILVIIILILMVLYRNLYGSYKKTKGAAK